MIFSPEGRIPMPSKEQNYVRAPLLQAGEAAKYLGVGRKIIYQLIERGEITVVKAKGSRVLIEKQSLDDIRSSGRLT